MLLFADCPEDIDRARDAFAAAGFTAQGLAGVIGPNGLSLLARDDFAPVLRRTNGGSPLDTLIRLLLCGVPVDRGAATRALAPLAVEDWIRAEAFDVVDDTVVSRITITPIEYEGHNWLVPADGSSLRDRAGDHVLGVGPASMTLAGLTIRQPVDRCLDLGTGSGIQALVASTHATRVDATDRNPRAAAFAAFTMRLNGVENVEIAEGDLFEPVDGRPYDLIVSNPPFVISPQRQFIYRDSGLAGDEICRRIVREAPARLEDGGWCQLLANWAHLEGVNWQDRLATWIDDIGCDAWIAQSRVQDAETYASTWIHHDYPSGNAALFDEWMDHYEQIGLEGVGFGLITLRKTSRSNPWLRIEELARDFLLPCGDEIAAAFDRGVWLGSDGADDAKLLDTILVVNPHTELRQTHYAAEGEWYLDESMLQLGYGLNYSGGIDEFGAELVAGCDGATRLGDLVHRVASSIGVDPVDITPLSLTIVRQMMQQGFVRLA